MKFNSVYLTLWVIILPLLCGAQNWQPSGLVNKSIICIKVHPTDTNRVFAGVQNEGIYASTDGGKTWIASWKGMESVFSIIIDKYNSQTIYAGKAGAVLISKNGGSSFETLSSVGDLQVNSIIIDESPYKAILIGTSSGVMKSLDKGKTFQTAGLSGQEIASIAIHNRKNNQPLIFAATLGSGIFKSENYGLTWEPVNNGLTDLNVYSILFDMKNPNIVIAGTLEAGVFYSDNQGQNWNLLQSLLNLDIKPGQGYKLAQAIHGQTYQTILYVTNFGGNLYTSNNSGESWEKISAPQDNVVGMCIGVANVVPSSIYLGTSDGIFKLEEERKEQEKEEE